VDRLRHEGCGDLIVHDPIYISAPLLTEIRFPDGSSYVPSYAEHSGGCEAGIIQSLKLPTLGSIRWTNGLYSLPQKECDENTGIWVSGTAGVVKRSLYDTDTATVPLGEWEYSPATLVRAADGSFSTDDPNDTLVYCGAEKILRPYGLAPSLVTTKVSQKQRVDTPTGPALAPVGGSTVHYFSGTRNGDRAVVLGHKVQEYGLGFSRHFPAATNGARFLASEQKDEAGTVVQSVYRTYERDGAVGITPINVRLQGELTVYDTDQNCAGQKCWKDVDHTVYAGYGRYKQTTTTSNFVPALTRTVFTNYLPRTDTWILGLYDSAWAQEAGIATKQAFTFDENGFLSTQRTFAATASTASAIPANNRKDLLAVFCRDSRGFLKAEKFFGGDGASADLPTTSLCDTAPRATE
jgi:hypothetical protein